MDGILTEWSSTDSRSNDHTNALSFKHQNSSVPSILNVKTRSASGMPLMSVISSSRSVSGINISFVTDKPPSDCQFFWSLMARTTSLRSSIEESSKRTALDLITGAHLKSRVSREDIHIMCESQIRYFNLLQTIQFPSLAARQLHCIREPHAIFLRWRDDRCAARLRRL